MRKIVDLTHKIFGKLTVIKQAGKNKFKHILWLCRCFCGNKTIVSSGNLTSGNTKSCGCLLKKGNDFKHGCAKRGKESRTYHVWEGMKQRCNNPNNRSYSRYGGRRIKVCGRWLNKKTGFQNFLKDMGECPTGKSLDRINNNGDYCKENCKWSTSKEQSRNMGNNHLLKYNGKELCFSEWEELTGIPQATIRTRVKRGWSIKRTLTTPVNYRKTK
jgi:hypothetical protein